MISILIPIYNEEKNVKKCIQEIHRVLRNQEHRFILVNDGSKDNSYKILVKLSAKLPITLLNHSINKGVAEALKTGLASLERESRDSDILIIMEGDGTSTPELIKDLVGEIKKGADLVIASRYSPGGAYRNFPLKRLVLSRLANLTLGLFFPKKGVKDYTIFYRAYKMKVIKKAIKRYKSELIRTKYFTANSELLIKCMKFTNRIEEVPFVYDYGKKKGISGMKIMSNVRQYLRLIVNKFYQ